MVLVEFVEEEGGLNMSPSSNPFDCTEPGAAVRSSSQPGQRVEDD